VNGSFEAVSPDSSVWLDQIDRRWQAKNNTTSGLTGSLVRYATSPVVIAAWEKTALDLGYPDKPVGWSTILDRALRDNTFRWSHPSSATAMGLLATTAEFYAGSGNPAKLTREDVERPETLDYVRRIERTVQPYGGKTEDQLIERLLDPGSASLDAFVVQEQFVVQFNSRTKGDRLVALYPAEGTLWLDHPLALLESPSLTDKQRRAYQAFVAYLGQPSTGEMILAEGYRPVDLRVAVDESNSPLNPEAGVDTLKPATSLPLPSIAVLESIRDWWTLQNR
jgi:Ca-activated chloride channel family protein